MLEPRWGRPLPWPKIYTGGLSPQASASTLTPRWHSSPPLEMLPSSFPALVQTQAQIHTLWQSVADGAGTRAGRHHESETPGWGSHQIRQCKALGSTGEKQKARGRGENSPATSGHKPQVVPWTEGSSTLLLAGTEERQHRMLHSYPTKPGPTAGFFSSFTGFTTKRKKTHWIHLHAVSTLRLHQYQTTINLK